MRAPLNPYRREYKSLSVRDVLDAREAYHAHLIALENVFATAVGLFRIHAEAPDAGTATTASAGASRSKMSTARTFANSAVKPWSWPCVLVLVRRWMAEEEVRRKPDEVVPPFLYLPNGRVIPVCVLCADLDTEARPTVVPVPPLATGLGPGFPVVTTIQGAERFGTVACIVKGTDRYYALTARHVLGSPGTPVGSEFVALDRPTVGKTAAAALGKKPFEAVYRGLPGPQSLSTLDVGLLEPTSLERWSSDMRELGSIGELIDFSSESATLDWVGRRVLGYGAASGRVDGEIWGLFYRYLTVGGTDYIADFLIGGSDGNALGINPGDSGTLLCISPSEFQPQDDDATVQRNRQGQALMRPFAVLWGGQRVQAPGEPMATQFGLAASLATICRELDVELVTDWRRQAREYWGQFGHYKIAELAVQQLKGSLKTFFTKHAALITFPGIQAPQELDPATDFVPLADVPDLVWKHNINRSGVGVRSGAENPNHYADVDMDIGGGKTLASLGTDAKAWLAAYKAKGIKWQHQGLLPFRVWQVFEEMVARVKDGDQVGYLAACGVLAHYIGDACQPLHGSIHADGLDGTATGVHMTYEDRMIDDFAAQLAPLTTQALAAQPALVKIATGEKAAAAVLALMAQCAAAVPPKDLCTEYDQHHQGAPKKGGDRLAAPFLFQKFGTGTAECLALGIQLLASLWKSAYDTGGGTSSMLKAVGQGEVQALYRQKDDLAPSFTLKTWIEKVLA